MKPIDSSDSEAIGWHLIARGGDMTARVHPKMRLGVLPSGDFSFEAPNAVVQLDLAGEALLLEVVGQDHELELETGERVQTLRVGAQTHVCLYFLGHTLDIDNDFAVAVASPPGDALTLSVVPKGEPRQPLGSSSASAHAGDILVPERSSVTPLKAVPVDHLNREHSAAARDKRQPQTKRLNVRRVVLALVASVLVVAGLVVTALYVASRSVEESMTLPIAEIAADADDSSAGSLAEETAETEEIEGTVALKPAAAVEQSPGEPAGVSEDMLARLSALLEAEPLPDKATIDFAVESLRSLMIAYPNDPRIPAALASLNVRLVQEARQSYDQGDAFLAGRLIEQATVLGLADASVAETLDYFASRPPGAAAASTAAAPAVEPPRQEVVAEPEPVVTDAEAEAALIASLAREEAAPVDGQDTAAAAAEAGESGLDSLVGSATGLGMGGVAVEVTVEDMAPPLAAEGGDVSANELPVGFAVDEPLAGTDQATGDQRLSNSDFESPPPGPRFQPYSLLNPVRQAPLVYPTRAVEGAEGSINVEFTVTETGRVIDVEVSGEAPAIFLREAARTIRSWRFTPVLRDGAAVPVRTALRVTYRS